MNQKQEAILNHLTKCYDALRIGYMNLFTLQNFLSGYSRRETNVEFHLDTDYHMDTCDVYGHDEDETEITGFLVKDKKLYGLTNGEYLIDPVNLTEDLLEQFLKAITNQDHIRDINPFYE